MSSDGERVSVQTYVSSSQRELWREEADDLDMSQAEYVRTMIQAGRRSFSLDTADSLNTEPRNADEPSSSNATPGVDGLKDRILDVLDSEEFADWDTLLAGVTDDIEERLEEAIQELDAEGRIKHSPRRGYTVVDDGR
ncbi:hypothetical protein HWV23_01120 [Natronomonas halophila]|uniref:DUF5805 domain-containing protein n=1 Tax=Natronomonas halophila TaxID=2747817 RepID=UPI0015B53994|nr:DUF5805 domain-containing protein [Natronomonas halophila]QLD84365.1 hypothetical protein HWV23_01120 [Natronomonas halophila]